MDKTRSIILATLLAALCGGAAIASEPARPTEAFRKEHAEIRVHLGHLDQWVGKLATAAPAEREATMKRVAGFLRDHIAKHAEIEEAKLYPLVDRHAETGARRYTDTMRYEHGLIGQQIKDLEAMAEGGADATKFARRADRLLGIIDAHFDKEEEVLLPILDAKATAKEVEDALGGHGGHAH